MKNAQEKIIKAIYEFLIEDMDEVMSLEEFTKEYKEWGMLVAVYNFGFLVGNMPEAE
jgi:hypothetical protein